MFINIEFKKNLGVQMKSLKKKEIKQVSKAKYLWNKAKRALGAAMIMSAAASFSACHGNTNIPQYDVCQDDNVRMVIRLSVDGREIDVENKKSISINGKDYKVEVVNDGNLLFTSDDGETIVLTRDGLTDINGASVSDVDRLVDMVAYSTRILLKLEGSKSVMNYILEEFETAQVDVGSVFEISAKRIDSWDKQGVITRLSISYNGSEHQYVNLALGSTEEVEFNGKSIKVSLIDTAVDLFAAEDAVLCDINSPLAILNINGEDVSLNEGKMETVGPVSVELNKIFPGNSQDTIMAELFLSTSQMSLVRVVSLNDRIELNDNGERVSIQLTNVGFSD